MKDSATSSTPDAGMIPNQGYAGFGRRLAANIIDGFILTLVNLSIVFGLGLGGMKSGLSGFIGFLIGAGYLIFFWVSQNGQTLGKRAMAVRIVREDGEPVDFATAIVRYIGYIISSAVLFLGFIWVAFDSKKQGWHDKIAKTYVVKTEGKPKTWLAVVIVIVYVLVSIAAVALGVTALTGLKTAKQNNLQQLNRFAPQLTQNFVNQLVDSTFSEVNTWRANHNFPQFLPDQKLCAYAQKRLEQLSTLDDQYDGARGFYEDTANPTMSRAYFSDYSSMAEMFQAMSSSLKSQDVVNAWTTGQESNMRRSDLTHACIQADTKSLIFIGGVKKK